MSDTESSTESTATESTESVEGANKKTKYDWEDPCWDHHFGMEDHSAGGSYSNKGRTAAVWRTLEAYGFRRSADKKSFDGLKPSGCFEYFVRKNVRREENLAEDGQIVGYETPELAEKIRSSHHIGYLEGPERKAILEEEDAELVTRALSTENIMRPNPDATEGNWSSQHLYYTDLFYSFCRGGLEEEKCTWHCRICKTCQDWRDWHCKGCNKCQYGASIPCENCNPEEFASWKSATGW
ncbi:hypothetical protein THAOC_30970 [Thalassiosira oceanica]|uniref:Uncharacterized protein n=1 Tax=Thalassiosira oceanica TaxID=159749 RepID=K0RCW7_THAOC|nr:hypothetical protein THAOC_30970 [Thalassiosira oceanica]|mmetsp:Transcript_28939/g.65911  ORF Transcript_28939/g.65911 Transcript_28939/m.65911 type:complete len:239 (+) Transcript_28939:51-767(+)|eukprot:EJK50099.1 hypothetical protein THAOC_30970 [Thalassiosira oceanica]